MDVMYKLLFEIADRVMLLYDPCKLDGGRCLAGDPNPCCCNKTVYPRDDINDFRCRHYEDGKCLFPNLGCRIWLCSTAIRQADPKCIEVLTAIEVIAKVYGFVEPPYLGEPYCGADNP